MAEKDYDLEIKNYIEKMIEIHNWTMLNDKAYHEKKSWPLTRRRWEEERSQTLLLRKRCGQKKDKNDKPKGKGGVK